MNKIIIITFAFFSFISLEAQVGIERDNVSDGAILDFPSPAKKGILLPKNTDTANSGTEPGSLAFDVATQTVVYYSDKDINGSTEGWVPLTSATTTTVKSDKENFNNAVENGQGVVITDDTNHTAEPLGVLELKSNKKALILPIVESVENLPIGEAGMICYIKSSQVLAVFNGEMWSFWK